MRDSQPFLYWTIIAIVSSNLGEFITLDNFRIMEPYTALLEEQIRTAPASIHKTQALLFLCTWPLTCPIWPDTDPCREYYVVALQAARGIGLDKLGVPPPSETPEVGSESQDKVNTWLGCFYVVTSYVSPSRPPPSRQEARTLTHVSSLVA
ncbi:hypothetical protein IMZ48_17660 [Candidatus Bathyarchaeota archaeon]|nr:hypothetical protein [Candidatus Bathyarchaeota archaeon]